MNADALDHRKSTAMATIRIWQTSVSKWYSSNSKSTQITVAKPSTPAVTFFSRHSKMSAAVIHREFLVYIYKYKQENTKREGFCKSTHLMGIEVLQIHLESLAGDVGA